MRRSSVFDTLIGSEGANGRLRLGRLGAVLSVLDSLVTEGRLDALIAESIFQRSIHKGGQDGYNAAAIFAFQQAMAIPPSPGLFEDEAREDLAAAFPALVRILSREGATRSAVARLRTVH